MRRTIGAAAYLRLLDAFQSGRADEAITGVVGGEGGAPAVGGREARQRAERYEVQLSRQQGRVAAAIQAVREARAALAEPVFYGMQVSRRRFMARLWQQHGDLLDLAAEPERLLSASDVLSTELLEQVQHGVAKLGNQFDKP